MNLLEIADKLRVKQYPAYHGKQITMVWNATGLCWSYDGELAAKAEFVRELQIKEQQL